MKGMDKRSVENGKPIMICGECGNAKSECICSGLYTKGK